jgi:hypothetical protein
LVVLLKFKTTKEAKKSISAENRGIIPTTAVFLAAIP